MPRLGYSYSWRSRLDNFDLCITVKVWSRSVVFRWNFCQSTCFRKTYPCRFRLLRQRISTRPRAWCFFGLETNEEFGVCWLSRCSWSGSHICYRHIFELIDIIFSDTWWRISNKSKSFCFTNCSKFRRFSLNFWIVFDNTYWGARVLMVLKSALATKDSPWILLVETDSFSSVLLAAWSNLRWSRIMRTLWKREMRRGFELGHHWLSREAERFDCVALWANFKFVIFQLLLQSGWKPLLTFDLIFTRIIFNLFGLLIFCGKYSLTLLVIQRCWRALWLMD